MKINAQLALMVQKKVGSLTFYPVCVPRQNEGPEDPDGPWERLN